MTDVPKQTRVHFGATKVAPDLMYNVIRKITNGPPPFEDFSVAGLDITSRPNGENFDVFVRNRAAGRQWCYEFEINVFLTDPGNRGWKFSYPNTQFGVLEFENSIEDFHEDFIMLKLMAA